MINDTGLKQILSRISGISVGGEGEWEIRAMRLIRSGGTVYFEAGTPTHFMGKGKCTFAWQITGGYQSDIETMKIYSPTGLDDKEVIAEGLQNAPLAAGTTTWHQNIYLKITVTEV